MSRLFIYDALLKQILTFFERNYVDLPEEIKGVTGFPNAEHFDTAKVMHRTIRDVGKRFRQTICVSCWHAQDYESAGMWSQYSKSNDGIAIKSSFSRLTNALSADTEHSIIVSMVDYIDYKKDSINVGNLPNPYVKKRKSSEHERELRSLIWKSDNLPTQEELNIPGAFDPPEGLYIPVHLDILIESVFVSPAAPSWYHELTEHVLNRFGLTFPVYHSELGE